MDKKVIDDGRVLFVSFFWHRRGRRGNRGLMTPAIVPHSFHNSLNGDGGRRGLRMTARGDGYGHEYNRDRGGGFGAAMLECVNHSKMITSGA
jgi:hypothetical protein